MSSPEIFLMSLPKGDGGGGGNQEGELGELFKRGVNDRKTSIDLKKKPKVSKLKHTLNIWEEANRQFGNGGQAPPPPPQLAYKLIVDRSSILKMADRLMTHFACGPLNCNPYELVRHLRNRLLENKDQRDQFSVLSFYTVNSSFMSDLCFRKQQRTTSWAEVHPCWSRSQRILVIWTPWQKHCMLDMNKPLLNFFFCFSLVHFIPSCRRQQQKTRQIHCSHRFQVDHHTTSKKALAKEPCNVPLPLERPKFAGVSDKLMLAALISEHKNTLCQKPQTKPLFYPFQSYHNGPNLTWTC